MTARVRAWLPSLAGAAVLAVVVVRSGTAPLRRALSSLSVGGLGAALVLGALITLGCAWRWVLVARRLGLPLTAAQAVAACYRSQFLNTVLPGGLLGDVHRGFSHGRSAAGRRRALRAVAWERGLGQGFSLLATAVLVAAVPSGLGSGARWCAAAGLLAAAAAAWWWRQRGRRRGTDRWALAPVLPAVGAVSVAVLALHVAMFAVAARTVGVALTPGLVPVVLVVLAAAALPVNLGGWGPREGTAVWIFAVTGLDAGQGLAASVAFGILGAVANLPGAAVLVGTALPARRRRRPAPSPVVATPAIPALEGATGA